MKPEQKMSKPSKGEKTPGQRKATAAQIAARVEELLRIRLDGAELWDIREYVREKVAAKDPVWGDKLPSDSQLYRYLEKVDEQIADSCRDSRRKLIRRHLAQRRNLYAKAVSQGDLRTALAVARDEAELQALYPDKDAEATKRIASLEKELHEIRNLQAARLVGGGNAGTSPEPPASDATPAPGPVGPPVSDGQD
jgi:hypothetical protein